MSNTRKRRPTLTRRVAAATSELPRCECQHRYEDDGRCTSEATARVTTVCAVEDCDCAVTVHLVCGPCLSSWRRMASRDGIELRVLALS